MRGSGLRSGRNKRPSSLSLAYDAHGAGRTAARAVGLHPASALGDSSPLQLFVGPVGPRRRGTLALVALTAILAALLAAATGAAAATPTATIEPVTAITGTSAHFAGQVNANGTEPADETACSFLYLTDAEFQPRNEVQRLTVKAVSGTYRINFAAPESPPEATAPIAFDATAAEVQAALEALANVGAGNMVVGGGPGDEKGSHPYTITFVGSLGSKNLGGVAPEPIDLAGPEAGVGTTTVKEGHQGFEGAPSLPCSPAVVTGTTPTAVSLDNKRLKPGNLYHVRLQAVNGEAHAATDDTTFTTPPIAPIVRTGGAHVTSTGGTLTGSVDPGGAETTYHFDYGPGLSLHTPDEVLAGSNERTPVTAQVGGLASSTTYPFRLVAENSVGPAVGATRNFTTDAATPGACPNEAFRIGFAANLPECRAYELVNPPSLSFGDVMRTPPAGDDGEWMGFTTMVAGDGALGAQVGSYMLAHRTPTGWSTIDSNGATIHGYPVLVNSSIQGYSADHTKALLWSNLEMDPRDTGGADDVYELAVGTGVAHLLSYGPLGNGGFPTKPIGASPDFSRVIFLAPKLTADAPDPGISTADFPIYAREGEKLEVVSVLPNGESTYGPPAASWTDRGLGSTLFFGAKAPHGGAHGVSDDARRVFFVSNVTHGLYLRDMEVTPPRTLTLSESERSGEIGNLDGSATFIGATHDGSVAYFEDPHQLTDAATPGGGIYRWDIDAPAGHRLEQLTPANGDPVEFGINVGLKIGTAILSDDGSHIYFTSSTKLTPDAAEGETNVYVWSSAGTKLVATAPSATRVERVSIDGRYMVFVSSSSVDGGTNAGHAAIYEYDAATEDVSCASCRPDGSPSEADSYLSGYPNAPITNDITQTRNIANDGTVFFGSFDRIVPADQTSYGDVYEYRAGKVSLLTAGKGDRSSFPGDNSDDGKTVFVLSPTALLPQDKDAEELDLYAVRVDGGFPSPPAPAAPCEGEACRGAVSNPTPEVRATTPNFVGPGNSRSNVNHGQKHKKHHKKKHHKKHGKKQHGAKGGKRKAGTNGRAGR